jgi:UDP-glucose 4-epimerase
VQILILGSEGFIGSHLVSYFSQKGWQVYGADLMEVGTQHYHYSKISRLSPEFDELLALTSFDVCINAAGSGNVPYSMTHPVSDFEANSLDTLRILDGLRRHQPQCRYLHISSAAVFGNPQQLPVRENDRKEPMSPYGWHKLISEKICREYTQVYKLHTVIVRPFSVFGPRLKKQLIWDLSQKIKRATPGAIVELWGTGSESRDFIYITSLAEAFYCIINKALFEAEEYNIASGEETSIKTAAELVVEQFNKPVRLQFNQQVRAGDPQNWKADISRLKALGFSNTVSFEQGIKQTVEWLKDLE